MGCTHSCSSIVYLNICIGIEEVGNIKTNPNFFTLNGKCSAEITNALATYYKENCIFVQNENEVSTKKGVIFFFKPQLWFYFIPCIFAACNNKVKLFLSHKRFVCELIM